MKKRFATLSLALILACSLAIPAGAVENSSVADNIIADSKPVAVEVDSNGRFSTTTQKYDDVLKYTISFPSTTELHALNASSATATEKERNLSNALVAKEYVTSLNLTSSGWECIEQACLRQLDTLASEPDGILISYSVMLPLSSDTSVQPTATSIANYGTYSGIQFYSNTYSSYTKEYKKNSITARDKIKSWGSGALDLVLCFASAKITVPFTIVRTAMSAPSSYTVTDEAYIEYYFNLNSNCRGIYSKNANGTYRMLTSSETGTVAPAVLFHPVDPNYPTLISRNLSKKAVSTSNYDNKNWQLQVAYHQYSNNAYGNDPFKMTLSSLAQSSTWS